MKHHHAGSAQRSGMVASPSPANPTTPYAMACVVGSVAISNHSKTCSLGARPVRRRVERPAGNKRIPNASPSSLKYQRDGCAQSTMTDRLAARVVGISSRRLGAARSVQPRQARSPRTGPSFIPSRLWALASSPQGEGFPNPHTCHRLYASTNTRVSPRGSPSVSVEAWRT